MVTNLFIPTIIVIEEKMYKMSEFNFECIIGIFTLQDVLSSIVIILVDFSP